MVQWLIRAHKKQSVYRHAAEQYENQVKYWQNVLQRAVAAVKFLAERGFALRGDNEILGPPTKGNFLGILKIIFQFDAFLNEHLETNENKVKIKAFIYVSSRVGLRAGLVAEAFGKVLWLCLGSNPGRPVRSQTTC
jgi:hypothetical protein